jgi:hypothetical protein
MVISPYLGATYRVNQRSNFEIENLGAKRPNKRYRVLK